MITTVVFAYPVLHPRGGMASSIRTEQGVFIERRGDTLVVKAELPENDARGLPVKVTRHFNWNAVTWVEYDVDPDTVSSDQRRK